MNVVQCLSHSIEAYDMLRLYAFMGVDAFDIGGYIDPRSPHDDKRPAVEMPFHPDLKAAVDAIGAHDNLRAAQEHIPEAILDWADVIVFHHYLERLWGQWPRIERWLREGSHRRVIWRTVGQSVDGNEYTAQPFRNRGLQIVRYSPKERNIPNYAGEDALIRFYKDPAEWYGWTGDVATVINVTQDLAGRDPFTNYGFWEEATKGLSRTPLGPGSEQIGGAGPLTYPQMQAWLRKARCYLYTGTQPASYTLGLIEAMMTGIPVVSIGPEHMRLFAYGPAMFEGHELVYPGSWDDDPGRARNALGTFINNPDIAAMHAKWQRALAIELFGKETIASQWAAYLGVPVREAVLSA